MTNDRSPIAADLQLKSGQQSEDERTMLVTLLAHEFRTPLTSIKGFVELILDGEVGQVSDQQREFLAIVARNADRLIDLVNDRIASTRPEEAAAGGAAPALGAAPYPCAIGTVPRPRER
jgi:signal transduction histidine kinase